MCDLRVGALREKRKNGNEGGTKAEKLASKLARGKDGRQIVWATRDARCNISSLYFCEHNSQHVTRVQVSVDFVQIVWDTEKQLKSDFRSSSPRNFQSLSGLTIACVVFCLRALLITLFGFKNETVLLVKYPSVCDHLSLC